MCTNVADDLLAVLLAHQIARVTPKFPLVSSLIVGLEGRAHAGVHIKNGIVKMTALSFMSGKKCYSILGNARSTKRYFDSGEGKGGFGSLKLQSANTLVFKVDGIDNDERSKLVEVSIVVSSGFGIAFQSHICRLFGGEQACQGGRCGVFSSGWRREMIHEAGTAVRLSFRSFRRTESAIGVFGSGRCERQLLRRGLSGRVRFGLRRASKCSVQDGLEF